MGPSERRSNGPPHATIPHMSTCKLGIPVGDGVPAPPFPERPLDPGIKTAVLLVHVSSRCPDFAHCSSSKNPVALVPSILKRRIHVSRASVYDASNRPDSSALRKVLKDRLSHMM